MIPSNNREFVHFDIGVMGIPRVSLILTSAWRFLPSPWDLVVLYHSSI